MKNDWLTRIRSTLVPKYDLIPHGYDLDGNRPLEGLRGSSQSLMLSFLLNIDSGPVVMGIGGAASIVGIKTAIMYEDWQLALNMLAFLGRALWKIK